MTKPTRSAQHLRAMVQVHLITQPEAQRGNAQSPSLAPEAGSVTAHERDTKGRNWDIQELQRGDGMEGAFRAIVNGDARGVRSGFANCTGEVRLSSLSWSNLTQ